MTDFAKLKANRESKTAALVEASKGQQKSYDDDRFWKLTLDKEKKIGGAIIRFLPNIDDEVLDYITYYEHSFKNESNGKYYIERSLSSLNPPVRDSIADLNARLWATGLESNKTIARNQKRNQRFVANILVINDPAKPENNGKVFLYRFGPKIFGFIDTALHPEPDALTGVSPDVLNPFDMWEGANLELRIKDTQNGWNYDSSKWSSPSPIGANDAIIETVYKQIRSLKEFTDVSNYKSKEDLDKRLLEVLGTNVAGLDTIVGYNIPHIPTQQAQQTPAPTYKSTPAVDTNDIQFDIGTGSGNTEEDDLFNQLMA